ncbi:SEC-C domain-containing protein [uncultured Chryseobacterium sp.]|uniref:YecA family protein n=1 Tax=uncultured Chryseobacterium sp. TaxID=259322 RepID=UPI0025D14580|nr:SEC-C domain-containing protein [uncultured Chryseobacterium sp.]
MKLRRNDPCPCGSGSAYKFCCRNKPKEKRDKPKSNSQEYQIPFMSQLDRMDLLKTFAGLSVIPENHGKYIRLEELMVYTLLQEESGTKHTESITIKKFVDRNFSSHHMEDVCVNTFTDLITFYGGDYITFPGLAESSQEKLKNLLSAVFLDPKKNIPDWVKGNVRMSSLLMLGISDLIAKRLNYSRYAEGKNTQSQLFVPDQGKLEELKKAVTITSAEMDEFLREKEIDPEVLKLFTVDPEKEIGEHSFDPYSNAILYKPLLKTSEGYIVLSPSTISMSLTAFIWTMAKENSCMHVVNEAYHFLSWHNLQLQLRNMGFNHIEVGEFQNVEDSRSGFYKFDTDKVAYIRYLGDNGENYQVMGEGVNGSSPFGNDDDGKQAISDFKNLPEFKDYKVLSITLLSVIDEFAMYSIRENGAERVLAMPLHELSIISELGKADAIDLWKFTMARDRLKRTAPSFFSISFLDLFILYKKNSDSFYLSDDTPTIVPVIETGYAQEWYLESKIKSDKHSMMQNFGGRMKFVEVQKKDSFMPLYFSLRDVASGIPKFGVGGFEQPIWVMPDGMPSEASVGLKSMYLQVSEGIAYWLWQIQDGIKEALSQLGNAPLEVIFAFDKVEEFDVIRRDYTRVEDLPSFFKVHVVKDKIRVIIPTEILPFLYGVDNEGERVLVRQMISGFNEVLKLNGCQELTQTVIDHIIESDVPLGMKKKFYLLDTSDNFLIDPRNLEKHRYIQDYDTGKVSDQITTLLGTDCPAIGDIEEKSDREELSRKISEECLKGHLRDRLKELDGLELLKRLLGLNESLIKKREMLRIQTPTRIACFVSIDQQITDVYENLVDINRTTIAVRCLIEHVTAEQDTGARVPSTTDIDELIGIMDQIVSWGSIHDYILYDLFDIEMGILPSGRVGTTKKMVSDVFDPYYKSKTTENVVDAVQAFHQVFPKNITEEGGDVPENLDNAFIADYGVSFSRICAFSDSLADIGFGQSTAYGSLPLDELREEINKVAVDQFSDTEFENVVSYLSLVNRGTVENVDEDAGYDAIDIMPCRFNRMLSLLRKPLIIFDEGEDPKRIAVWGPRQILDSKKYLADQCLSDRIRVPKACKEIKKVTGSFADARGKKLVQAIVDAIDPTGLMIDQEVPISPKRQLKHTKDLGDVDVLIIDQETKMIYSLESKSMSPSRNIKEMVSEVSKLFGGSKKGWIDKHLERHDWLENNKDQLGAKYGIDLSDFGVKSYFVTDEDMLTPHLKKMTLPLPFITRYDLEKHGYNAIKV